MSSTLGNTNEPDGSSYLDKSKKIKRAKDIDNYGTSKREGFGNNDEEYEEDEEDDERTEDDDGKRTNSNWGRFLKSLLVYLIITIIVGVIGCGFIYLTELNEVEMENVFPTTNDFYNASGIKEDSITVSKCSDEDKSKTNEVVKNVVGSILEDNFPYSLIKKLPEGKKISDMGMIDRLTNWFAGTVKASFLFNRILIKRWLSVFKDNGRSPLSNHAFQIYVGLPFTFLMSLVALGTGFGSAFFGAFKADSTVTIWGMFLMFTWSMSFLMGFVIFLRFIVTLIFLPMSQDWQQIAKTMACNVKVLVILFGFFATGAAYESLDAVIAGVMGIVYLMLVSYTVVKYFTKLFL